MKIHGCLWGMIVSIILWIIIILLIGCRVQSPKKRGFILTPDGWALKDTLTTSEKKMYREWHKEQKTSLKQVDGKSRENSETEK